MNRAHRSAAVLVTAIMLVVTGQSAALAAVASAWTATKTCSSFSLSKCSVLAEGGSNYAWADDGKCANSVGISVKYGSANTISQAVFAGDYVKVTKTGVTYYKAWHE